MSGSPVKRDRVERLIARLAEPEALDGICDSICEGGSLVLVARQWDVPYARLYAWVHDRDHPERLEKYATALEGRRAFFTESIAVRLYGMQEADLSRCYSDRGDLLPMNKWPDNVKKVLHSLETITDEDGKVKKKIRLHDPLRAMELLGRYVKMYTDRTEHAVGVTLESLVNASISPPKGVPPSPPAIDHTKGPAHG